ncbi:MGT family glycosyltransferase, partial [Thelonectria olida]
KTLQGPDAFIHDLINIFCKSLPSQHEALQRALRMLSNKYSGTPIILMTEGLNFGAFPVILGAPGIRPTGFLVVGLNPIFMSSVDHPPFGPGLPPDSSPEGKERNKAANESQKEFFAQAQTTFTEALSSVGAKKPEVFLLDAIYRLSDRFIQLCTPSVEYPRSDAPETLRFAGGYPKALRGLTPTRPTWWHEVTDNGSKRIVFVCQGTAATELNQLVIPTMSAFRLRSQIIIVVALGKRGATLPADVEVPSNCRVADYISYDDVLPHCDVFITTGGYGAFQRALANGTPMVISGTTEDKPETAARGQWAGVAVNLQTSNPSTEQLKDAVDEVLGNERYKTRATEIQAEMATYDPMGVIIENIDELAGRSAII